jgi:hypothetical protein
MEYQSKIVGFNRRKIKFAEDDSRKINLPVETVLKSHLRRKKTKNKYAKAFRHFILTVDEAIRVRHEADRKCGTLSDRGMSTHRRLQLLQKLGISSILQFECEITTEKSGQ